MKAISAGVKYPNTPESDKQREVLHEVVMSDKSVMTVMATDPLDAIKVAEFISETTKGK